MSDFEERLYQLAIPDPSTCLHCGVDVWPLASQPGVWLDDHGIPYCAEDRPHQPTVVPDDLTTIGAP